MGSNLTKAQVIKAMEEYLDRPDPVVSEEDLEKSENDHKSVASSESLRTSKKSISGAPKMTKIRAIRAIRDLLEIAEEYLLSTEPETRDIAISEISSSEESSKSDPEKMRKKKLKKTKKKDCQVEEPLVSSTPPWVESITENMKGITRRLHTLETEIKGLSERLCALEGNSQINWELPVFENENGQRIHHSLDFKTIKNIKEAVMTYGPQAPFTLSMLESLNTFNLTPSDWKSLCKAVLSGGQYLVWRSQFQELCIETAKRNAAAGFGDHNIEMLTGEGQFADSQAQKYYAPGVYAQINAAVLQAWKTLQGPGDLQGSLSKVIQGPNEPYADFADRLLRTAGRLFGDVDQAMPLVVQLAYENANKYCQEAIRPWRNKKDLSIYIQLCKDITDAFVTGNVIAAAMREASPQNFTRAQPRHYNQSGYSRQNYHNQSGYSRQYPQREIRPSSYRAPGRCPRCKKGNHWANKCHSKFDIYGNHLSRNSKNGARGPMPRGPQMYEALEEEYPQASTQMLPRHNPYYPYTPLPEEQEGMQD